MTSVLLLGEFIRVNTAECEELILEMSLHVLDLLHSLAVAVWGGEAGGSQHDQLFVNVTQLPVEILGFVALLLNPLLC